MTDTMIERVARRLAQLEVGEGERLADAFWHQFIGDARSVLTAMREPTEAMIEAAYAVEPDGRVPALSDAWTAMIDAALAEDLN